MIGFLKMLSPSAWIIAGLALALALSGAALKVQASRLEACNARVAEWKSKVELQNQKIEAFRAEAALMAESLKKHKLEAARLRAESRKKVREMMEEPAAKTCGEGVARAARNAKERYGE